MLNAHLSAVDSNYCGNLVDKVRDKTAVFQHRRLYFYPLPQKWAKVKTVPSMLFRIVQPSEFVKC